MSKSALIGKKVRQNLPNLKKRLRKLPQKFTAKGTQLRLRGYAGSEN